MSTASSAADVSRAAALQVVNRYGRASRSINGKPAAVLMSPREFDQLTYHARVVAKVNTGLADIEAGRVRDAEDVFDELEAELAPVPALKRKPTKR